MKRFWILFLVLLNFGYGQRLVCVGAEWTFDDFIPFGPPSYIIHPITVKITKDTVINGVQCQKLELVLPREVFIGAQRQCFYLCS